VSTALTKADRVGHSRTVVEPRFRSCQSVTPAAIASDAYVSTLSSSSPLTYEESGFSVAPVHAFRFGWGFSSASSFLGRVIAVPAGLRPARFHVIPACLSAAPRRRCPPWRQPAWLGRSLRVPLIPLAGQDGVVVVALRSLPLSHYG